MIDTEIKYKKTGLDWMPEVPEHWETRRLKSFIDFVNRGNTPNYVEKSPFKVVNQATFSKGDWDETNIRYSDFGEKELKGKIQRNDVLLASTGGGVLGKIYFFDFDDENYVADSHVTILRDSKRRFVPEFLYYFLFINYKLINGILAEGSTNQTELQKEWLLNLKVALPPLTEQAAIVQYIKAQEEKINLFIQKKQRFIELLKEQKLRTINIAVTKGTNEKVKMKPTGVVWLDLVPEHWVFGKITYFAEVKDGTHDTPQYVEPSDDSIPFVTSAVFYDGYIDFANAKHISKQDHINIYKRSNTEKNDILMSMIGGNIGSCVLVDTDTEFSIKNVCLYKTSNSKNLDANFFLYLLKSIQLKVQIQLTQSGSAQPFLGLGELRAMRFFFPPLEEQKQIVSHIKTETATIDSAIAKAEREIELIREYKEAMISEAVMGKRNVNQN